MAVTSISSGLGRVCGVVIRARTLSQGVYDIVAGERGLVLVPLWGPGVARPTALLLGGFQGGIIGHRRGGDNDARRREEYLAMSADELARHYFSHRVVRRSEVVRSHVWDHGGSGKLRLELTDGASFTFRWERRANRDIDAARMFITALGPALDVTH
jgi:hypothetical protein